MIILKSKNPLFITLILLFSYFCFGLTTETPLKKISKQQA